LDTSHINEGFKITNPNKTSQGVLKLIYNAYSVGYSVISFLYIEITATNKLPWHMNCTTNTEKKELNLPKGILHFFWK